MGASFDTVEAQKQFADAEGFPYRLLADTSKAMGQAYEVDQPERGFPRRITYLIDPGGVIVCSYDLAGQDLETHSQTVLDDIRARS